MPVALCFPWVVARPRAEAFPADGTLGTEDLTKRSRCFTPLNTIALQTTVLQEHVAAHGRA